MCEMAAEHKGEGHKQNLAEQAKRFFGVGHQVRAPNALRIPLATCPSFYMEPCCRVQSLEDFAAMPGLWTTKPPWSQSTIEHLNTGQSA